MTPRIVRRAACTAAAVTVAVAGLLAAGSAASAAGLGSGEPARGHDIRLQVADAHAPHGSLASIDDARRAWALDQVQWAHDHGLTLQGE